MLSGFGYAWEVGTRCRLVHYNDRFLGLKFLELEILEFWVEVESGFKKNQNTPVENFLALEISKIPPPKVCLQ